MKLKHGLVTFFIATATALAQPPPPGGGMGGPPGGGGRQEGPGGPGRGHPPEGDMMENFFPPELIMHNQKAINLTSEQQTSIRSEMQKTVSKFTELQWQQSAEQQTMSDLAKQEHPDEKRVLAQLDKLLNIENEMKRLHLASLVRIKNILTPEQQSQLRQMGKRNHPPGQGPSADSSPDGSPPKQSQASPRDSDLDLDDYSFPNDEATVAGRQTY